MESKANYTIVGLFVIGFFVALFAFVVWMTRMDVHGQSTTYDIFFEGSVTGLRENEQVRYHGLPIGYIMSLEVDREDPEFIQVRVKISEPTLIREDTIASIEPKGLTGYSYIQIVGGSNTSPLLKAKKGETYPRIMSRQSKIEELFADAPKVLRRLTKLTDTLNRFFDKETSDHLKEAVVEAKTAAKEITSVFKKIEQQTERLTKDFNMITQKVGDTSDAVNNLMGDMKDVINKNRDAVESFTNNGLYAFSKLVTETNNTMQGLTRVVEQIEKSPSDFLHKNLNKGVELE
ncbi:MAG: MlaD family protein [Candidatus Nucleicultricaceae bacterium]